MRCSCKECGTYMIQAESRELAFDPRFDPENLASSFEQNGDEE